MNKLFQRISALTLGAMMVFSPTFLSADTTLTTPTELTAKHVLPTKAVLSWTLPEADENVDEYYVEVSTGDEVVATKTTVKKKYAVTDLEPSTTYSFTVQAMGEDGTLTSEKSEAATFTTMGPAPYVLLVDTSDITSDTVWPGSDIDAVKNMKNDGTSSYATEVVESNIRSGHIGNSHQNPEQALGKPDYNEATDTGYVSLGGPGGSVTLKMEDAIDGSTKKLKIYEIGGDQGGADEYVMVYLGETEDGPWINVGKGKGPIVVEL